MFLTPSNTYYDSDGSQRASKAWYLILACREAGPLDGMGITTRDEQYTCGTCGKAHSALYAIARKVALSQLGHFMMGTARIGGHSVVVSGNFGSDGLPDTIGQYGIPSALAPYFTKLPNDVASSYWHSGEDYHAGKSGDYRQLGLWALARLVYPMLVKAGLCPSSHERISGQWGHWATYAKYRTDTERRRASRDIDSAITATV